MRRRFVIDIVATLHSAAAFIVVDVIVVTVDSFGDLLYPDLVVLIFFLLLMSIPGELHTVAANTLLETYNALEACTNIF